MGFMENLKNLKSEQFSNLLWCVVDQQFGDRLAAAKVLEN